MFYHYKQLYPVIGERVYVSHDAIIIGAVELGDDVSIFFQSILRGDVNTIKIGKNTNVQDQSMLHVTEHNALVIGEGVSLGHRVTLHGCTIANNCLIGMGAIVLDGAFIDHSSVVAAGSVVPPGKRYPPFSLIMGSPAKVVRPLTEAEIKGYSNHYKAYLGYKENYLNPQQFGSIEKNQCSKLSK
jgi:carbonic anhydrase/acetyltransferase-like protein (isoleucine patch superfamily)